MAGLAGAGWDGAWIIGLMGGRSVVEACCASVVLWEASDTIDKVLTCAYRNEGGHHPGEKVGLTAVIVTDSFC